MAGFNRRCFTGVKTLKLLLLSVLFLSGGGDYAFITRLKVFRVLVTCSQSTKWEGVSSANGFFH